MSITMIFHTMLKVMFTELDELVVQVAMGLPLL